MIKNVLFDLDGTIFNTEPGIIKGIKHCLTELGMEIPDIDTMRKCIGPPFKLGFPTFLHIKDSDFDRAFKLYHDVYDDNYVFDSTVYPGVEECLKTLCDEGYSLSLCSSKPEVLCRALLERAGLDRYFTEIVGADFSRNIDKKIEVLNELYRRSPYKLREESVLIGDTKYDAEGARAAGITCIGITWGFGSKEDLLEYGAAVTLDSPMEVVAYIAQH